jgi:CRP-like cAMP-binding protein
MNAEKKIRSTALFATRSGELPKDWKAHPFLRGLSAEHVATLEDCAMLTEFEPGRVIFREGEIANRFYLILEGRVAVELTSPDRTPVVIEHVGSGGVLGWSWLFPPYGLHFTAEAVEPTRAIFFYGTWLRERCEENPELGYALAKHVFGVAAHRLETMTNRFGADRMT